MVQILKPKGSGFQTSYQTKKHVGAGSTGSGINRGHQESIKVDMDNLNEPGARGMKLDGPEMRAQGIRVPDLM